MAASLEVRLPFLDHRLVEFAFQIPPGQKIKAWIGATVVATLLGLFAFTWLLSTNELPWEEFTRASLDEHLAQGRPVLVDFTADW